MANMHKKQRRQDRDGQYNSYNVCVCIKMYTISFPQAMRYEYAKEGPRHGGPLRQYRACWCIC